MWLWLSINICHVQCWWQLDENWKTPKNIVDITCINTRMNNSLNELIIEKRTNQYQISNILYINGRLLTAQSDFTHCLLRYYSYIMLIDSWTRRKFRNVRVWATLNCWINVEVNCLIWSQGTLGIIEEHMHIKDALSRLVVEIAKREWPQQWPDMIDELNVICCCGVRIVFFHYFFFN